MKKKYLKIKINKRKMKKTFELKIENKEDEDVYKNHTTYHKGDAGLDLFIMKKQVIKAGETKLIDLEVKCQNKEVECKFWKWRIKNKKLNVYKYNSYFMMPRSSISKTPLIMHNSLGLIDSGYLGTLKIPLYNTSDKDFTLNVGERYVQLVNADLSPVKFKIVKELRKTTRGEGGFGSTGK